MPGWPLSDRTGSLLYHLLCLLDNKSHENPGEEGSILHRAAVTWRSIIHPEQRKRCIEEDEREISRRDARYLRGRGGREMREHTLHSPPSSLLLHTAAGLCC